jgi:hypothetical protein
MPNPDGLIKCFRQRQDRFDAAPRHFSANWRIRSDSDGTKLVLRNYRQRHSAYYFTIIRFKLLATEYLFQKEIKSILDTTQYIPFNFGSIETVRC